MFIMRHMLVTGAPGVAVEDVFIASILLLVATTIWFLFGDRR